MITAMDRIESFIANFTLDDFLVDEKTQSAVLFQLIVIGEAAARLPDEVKQRYPDVEWGPVISFRNRVVHGYFALDWSIVWRAATLNIGNLKPAIINIAALELDG